MRNKEKARVEMQVWLIYLLNCDELCYLRQVLLYQLLVLEHYLGGWSHCDSQSTVGLLDNNPVSFSTCCLARGVVLDQVEKADFADSTARSISLKRRKVNCMNNNVTARPPMQRKCEDLLCRLRDLGDQLVGGWVEHIHPPEWQLIRVWSVFLCPSPSWEDSWR